MLYVLFCEDRADSQPLRLATREAHLAFLDRHAGTLRLAGPMLSDDGSQMLGSLFIVEAASVDAVHALHAEDPYTQAGLWGNVVVHGFRQGIPKP